MRRVTSLAPPRCTPASKVTAERQAANFLFSTLSHCTTEQRNCSICEPEPDWGKLLLK